MREKPVPPFPLLLAAACLLAVPAAAQINPFRHQRSVPGLTTDDVRMLSESARRLNAAPQVRPGQAERWSNPQTGSSGTITVERVYRTGQMPCHSLRYVVSARGRQPSRTYAADWCRTQAGEWRMKD